MVILTNLVNTLNVKVIEHLVIILLGGSFCAGCQPSSSPQPLSASTNEFQADFDLLDGVQVMWSGYVDAMRTGEALRDGEIPARYWSDPIKALHPIKVYVDVANTVVVQAITNGFEHGKYIAPPYSSYTPQRDYILTRTDTNYLFMSDYRKRVELK